MYKISFIIDKKEICIQKKRNGPIMDGLIQLKSIKRLIDQNIMENQSAKEEDIPNGSGYQKYLQQINKGLIEKFPNSVLSIKEGIVELRSLQEIQQMMRAQNPNKIAGTSKGRGGNNMAQNVKKSVVSILKKVLGHAVYRQFEQRYINVHQLKSQKQNFILYFLFLHEMLFQRRISRQDIDSIISEINRRIQKYIHNSELRMEDDADRKQFHQRNLLEFRKFLEIDLDFTRPRSYVQISNWIKNQYLKKKAVYRQADMKVRKIILQSPNIRRIFINIDVKQESPSSESNSSGNIPIKMEENI